MKISGEFVLKKILDDYVVVPTGSTIVDFSSMITLNETGAFLWNQLLTDKTEEELLKSVCAEYDIDETTAKGDVAEFIEKLKSANLLI